MHVRDRRSERDGQIAALSLDECKRLLYTATRKPQTIRVTSKPVDAHRKRRVIALLETAVEGIASNRHHPQPGMHCSWCQFKNECLAWLPGMTVADVQRAA